MFLSHEDTKQLFDKFRHLKTQDELRMNEQLEQHGGRVMAIIDETITHIEQVDTVLELLKKNGKLHRRFRGFTPNMFWRIEEPFLCAVKITLEDRYTDNMEAIYKILIKFVLEHLIKGLQDDMANGPNGSRAS